MKSSDPDEDGGPDRLAAPLIGLLSLIPGLGITVAFVLGCALTLVTTLDWIAGLPRG